MAKLLIAGGVIESEILEKSTKEKDAYCTFVVREGKDQYTLFAFDAKDDVNTPYKKIKKLKIKKGDLINLSADITLKQKKIIPDEAWEKANLGEINQSVVILPYYKLETIDYAIPYEFRIKERTVGHSLSDFERGYTPC